MRLEVTVPEEHVGDIVGDLQQRRAIIVRTHTRGRNTVIEAHAPLANLFGYSSAMRGPEPRPRHLHDGAAQLRPRPGRGAGGVFIASSKQPGATEVGYASATPMNMAKGPVFV